MMTQASAALKLGLEILGYREVVLAGPERRTWPADRGGTTPAVVHLHTQVCFFRITIVRRNDDDQWRRLHFAWRVPSSTRSACSVAPLPAKNSRSRRLVAT